MSENPNVIARNVDGSPLQRARISTDNSTNVPPTIASPYIGVPEDVLDFVGMTLTLGTAQSAPHSGTMYFEFSPDATHWDISVPIIYSSSEPFVPYPLRKVLKWIRVRYVPNDDNLTEFRLTTLLHRLAPETLTRLFNQDIALSEPVKVVRAGMMAENLDATAMENLRASHARGLLVDPIPAGAAREDTQLDVLAAVRTLDSGSFSAPFTGINGDLVSLVAAMPIAQPTTTLRRAVNNAGFALANIIGMVVIGNDITLPVRALAQGILTLPTSLWDVVTGGSGGLVPGARYYLGAVLGTLTTTPPSTPGTYLSLVGNAVSSITLLVDPQPPILL